jgi:NAD-dependent dihydropyrimidine dehydrogenase PreA subunit
MSLFIEIELSSEGQKVTTLASLCPVNIFALSNGITVVVAERQDECTLCELCLKAAPPGSIRIHKLYSGEWLPDVNK